MCRKIRCDRESCKVLGFWVYLNKALVMSIEARVQEDSVFGKSMVDSYLHFHIWYFIGVLIVTVVKEQKSPIGEYKNHKDKSKPISRAK